MKRKQIKSKPKELKPSRIESENTRSPSFKYSTEEFSTAITLASIMTKENVDQSVGQTVDVINTSDNSTNESKDESYECVSTPKRTSDESLPKLQTLDSVPVSSAKPIDQNCVNPTQTPMNSNSYPNANYYGFYPMDPYGYYYQYPYYGTYSMQPNFSAMPSRPMQCPYCSMTSPPMAPIPMHPSFPMPYNMAAEPQKKISEPMGANTQVMSTQIPISSLYPYYQNGPKVTSAYVSSSEGQQN
jgi:hypothetical protein